MAVGRLKGKSRTEFAATAEVEVVFSQQHRLCLERVEASSNGAFGWSETDHDGIVDTQC